MSTPKNQITNKGIANESGLEVYMTVTIDSVEYLIPITVVLLIEIIAELIVKLIF
jgi:hypothetical protein